MSQCVTSAGKKEEKSSGQNDNHGSKIRILRRILLCIGAVLCLIALSLFIFDVKVTNDVVTVEYGEPVSHDPLDYLSGMKLSVKFSKMDFSRVNEEKTGKYKVKVKHLFNEYEFTLAIKDTTPPKVTLKGVKYVAELNKPSFAKDYVATCYDADDDVTFSFLNTASDASIEKEDEESVLFTEMGVHPVTLMATDSSGNHSSCYIYMIVDTAPKIYTYSPKSEYFVTLGKTIDLKEDVYAIDDLDGYITDNIRIKVPDYSTKEGDYTIKYSVTDSNGLTTEKEGIIHAYSALKIQDLFNTGRIKSQPSSVAGIINPYDAGYNIDENIDLAIERIKHAVVHVYYRKDYSTYWGSGFIVKITDDDIILCTNQHVVKDQSEVNICLYDGTQVTGHVVGTSVTPDVAFVRVYMEDLKPSLASTLKTIHINLNYYKTISSQPRFGMGMYVINENGSEMFKRTGYIVRKSGYLAEYFENFDYPVMEVSVKLTPGVSGSAIIDAHGNLLCMAAFYWDHDGTREYYGVSLEDILDFYEKVFNERLEYY